MDKTFSKMFVDDFCEKNRIKPSTLLLSNEDYLSLLNKCISELQVSRMALIITLVSLVASFLNPDLSKS